jgi:hypothetical protein
LTAVLALIFFASLVAQAAYILGSDVVHLATAQLEDDSYYYLQPAWLFWERGIFTFDGEVPTYGFQPLWMLVLTTLAGAVSSKVALLKGTLLLQALLYSITGLLLYLLGRNWLKGWAALSLPILWLLNPPLIGVYVSGKENTLYALLLVGSLLLSYRLWRRPGTIGTSIALGLLSGLLLLARVNSLPLVVALYVMLALRRPDGASARHRMANLAISVVVLALAVVPWGIYAQGSYGTLLPNSGSRKLISAWAALALYASREVPSLGLEWLGRLLPASERVFLLAPDRLQAPGHMDVLFYLTRFIPNLVLQFWKGLLLDWPESVGAILILFPLRLIVLGLLVSAAFSLRGLLPGIAGRQVANRLSSHWPLAILFLFALANGLVNGFLLPTFIYYGSWYAVPETLAVTIALSFIALLAAIDRFWNQVRLNRPLFFGAVLALVLIPVLAGFVREMRPVTRSAPQALQMEKWEAAGWLNEHIPPGSKVGAWNSGLLGYFAAGPTVVNLDGLANSPAFVESVYRNDLLFRHGLSGENALWQYIQEQGIRYLADLQDLAGIDEVRFRGVVPEANFRVVHEVEHTINWGTGPKRMMIVALDY